MATTTTSATSTSDSGVAPPDEAQRMMTPAEEAASTASRNNIPPHEYALYFSGTQEIQAFGAVVVLAPREPFEVLAASENVNEFIEFDDEHEHEQSGEDTVKSQLLKKPFLESIQEESAARLRSALLSRDPHLASPVTLWVRRKKEFRDTPVTAILHRSREGFVVDLERSSGISLENEKKILNSAAVQHDGAMHAHFAAEAAIARIQRVRFDEEALDESEQELCQVVAQEVRKLTGYSRVMCYRFHEDMHGEVIAESRADGVEQSFLGLHFPATDIPKYAMKSLIKNRSRVTADVQSEQKKVHRLSSIEGHVDLEKSNARGIHACHGQYLTNMGVRSTLTFSVVLPAWFNDNSKNDKVWAMIVCHNIGEARVAPYAERAATQFLVDAFAMRVQNMRGLSKLVQERSSAYIQSSLYTAVCNAAESCDDNHEILESLIKPLANQDGVPLVQRICKASGFALITGTRIATTGTTPPEGRIVEIRNFVESRMTAGDSMDGGNMYSTTSLHNAGFIGAEKLRGVVSGLLARRVECPSGNRNSYLLWFAPEWRREMTWAGSPDSQRASTSAVPSFFGKPSPLTPRSSFEQFLETVEFTSAPWNEQCEDAATAVRMLARNAIHEQSVESLSSKLVVCMNEKRISSMSRLQQVAGELNTIVDNAVLPVISVDCAMIIKGWNKAAAQFFSHATNSVIGSSLTEFANEASIKAIGDVLAMGKGASVFQERAEHEIVLTIGATSRRTKVLFVRNQHDYLVGVTLVAQDDHEQFSAGSVDLTLLENIKSPIAVLNKQGLVVGWNQPLARLTGADSASAMGLTVVGELFGVSGLLQTSREDAIKLEMAVQRCMVSEEESSAEITFRLESASRPTNTAINIWIAPKGQMIVMTVRDLTLHNALETATALKIAANAALEAKSKYVSYLCHEIRNPLNGILATVETMADEYASEEAMEMTPGAEADRKELIMTTLSCSKHLRRIVDTILDTSRAESGKLAINEEQFRVKDVITTVLAQIRSAAQEKGLKAISELRLGDCVEDVLLGDSVRIVQCVSNFAWNAIKFTPAGTIKVAAELKNPGDFGKQHVVFSVHDTGRGLTADEREKLFEPFETISDSSSASKVAKYGSTGLGLTLCRYLAGKMGGTVHCDSEFDVGSTFYLEVHLERAYKANENAATSAHSSKSAEKLETKPVIRQLCGDSAKELACAPKTVKKAIASPPMWTSSSSSSPAGANTPDSSSLPRALPPSHSCANYVTKPPLTPPPSVYYGTNTNTVAAMAAQMEMIAESKGWGMSMRVVRESSQGEDVLVEVQVGESVRQHWGSGSSLAAATSDAFFRALSLFQATMSTVAGPSPGPSPLPIDPPILEGMPVDAKQPVAAPSLTVNHKRRVLMVDDEHTNVLIIKRNLLKCGDWEVVTGTDGTDVIERMVEGMQRFDLVLLDENMPRMNGSVALRSVREHELKLDGVQPTPVVAVSGNFSEADMLWYAACGFDGILSKPIDMVKLNEHLQWILHYIGSEHDKLPNDAWQPREPDLIASRMVSEGVLITASSKHSRVFSRSVMLDTLAEATVPTPAPELATTQSVQSLLPIRRRQPWPQAKTVLDNVLVVDDDAVNRKILYRALRKAGVVNVANASNSHEFMQFVRDSSRPYDAVLMDEHMKGGLDGSKATEELRKYEKSRGLDEAVVVSISGSIQLGTSQEFLRLFSNNFDACGSKPLEIRTIAEDLLACVNFCHGHPPPADPSRSLRKISRDYGDLWGLPVGDNITVIVERGDYGVEK